MTEATKMYIECLEKINSPLVGYVDLFGKQIDGTDEEVEAYYRQSVLRIARNGKWKEEARSARKCLKDVAYMKMAQNDS